MLILKIYKKYYFNIFLNRIRVKKHLVISNHTTSTALVQPYFNALGYIDSMVIFIGTVYFYAIIGVIFQCIPTWPNK
jgi:hypothetical protein